MASAGNTQQTDERRILKKYLARYYRANEKRSILQWRLKRLRKDLPNQVGFAAHLSVPEVEAQIQRQRLAAEQSVLEIMDLLERLPSESMERTILELRHIDCKTWEKIYRAVHLTRTPCFRYYNKGLDILLGMREVRQILGLEDIAGG